MRPAVSFRRRKSGCRPSSRSWETGAETNVTLLLNSKSLEIEEGQDSRQRRATVEFYLPDAPYGLNRGEVRVTRDDTLAATTRSRSRLSARRPRRVLFIHEAGPHARIRSTIVPRSNRRRNRLYGGQRYIRSGRQYRGARSIPLSYRTDTAAPLEGYLKS